jgi:peroxidase
MMLIILIHFFLIWTGISRADCDFCNKTYVCSHQNTMYLFDGTCNNLETPWYGSTKTIYNRLLPPRYDDGIGMPRTVDDTGRQLPSPRTVSTMVHGPMDTNSPINMVAAIFGQVIAHDTILSLVATNVDCSYANQAMNPDCMRILDAYNHTLNIYISRSKAIRMKWNSTSEHREQVNDVTHWLDLSVIYGSDNKTSKSLRKMSDGLLQTSSISGLKSDQLPFGNIGGCKCGIGQNCFRSGEPRLNIHMVLISIQTIFVREHNKKAVELKALNPKWTDQALFNGARRLLIAEYQHIIYNEWLPLIVGKDLAKKYLLSPTNSTFIKYNPKINPNILNEFASAAFRFGHSMLKSYFIKRDTSYQITANLSFSNISFDTHEAYVNGGVDSLFLGGYISDFYLNHANSLFFVHFQGALLQNADLADAHFTSAIHNHLFDNFGKIGYSLDTININRGRDHGLGSYNDYRVFCGLNRAKNFADLTNIPGNVVEAFKKVYKTVDAIDLYTGGISETPIAGGTVGQTFACK